ncbi:MAG: metallophosphoesterase family protein [Myxococcales bacterium]|nr:metallophosphoesterase family protein [Myxococcales bacterium]MBK7198636.1 metallophosphoesterase family protein [Myxococcales bacterium]MBP6844443.1 metallophosphoesterase family protein [Kofleriaceae bacterium]
MARRDDGSLRIAAVADTHGRPHPDLLGRLRAWGPDAILLAGDIGAMAVVEALEAVAPVFAVRGNIDGDLALPDDVVLEVTGGSALTIFMTHIAVAGPRLRAEVARRATAAGAHLVVCGHSHVPFLGRDRGLAMFNPGSAGPRRFELPIVYGTMTLSARGLALAHVDVASGQPWSPP